MNYRWFIVAIAMVIYMIVVGTTFTAFGLFVLPVSQEFNLSRANTNTALIMLNFGQAALAPFIGRLLDRIRLKIIMASCAAMFGFSLVALGLSHSLWLNAFILSVFLSAACLGAGLIAVPVLIARWFDEKRGTAMVLAATGLSLGAIVVTPAVGWLIEQQGWRSALVTSGVLGGTIMLALALIVREQPIVQAIDRKNPSLTNTAGSSEQPASAEPVGTGPLLRMPQFWLIALSSGIAAAIAQALVITIVPIAVDSGLTTVQAARLLSIVGATAISSKLLLSFFADRIDRVWMIAALFLLGVPLNAALLASQGYLMLVICAGLLGITSGVLAPVLYALLADRFGLALFGTVQGLVMLVTAVASAAAVRLAGEVFDRTGGYDLLFGIFIVGEAVALAMIVAIRFMRQLTGETSQPRAA